MRLTILGLVVCSVIGSSTAQAQIVDSLDSLDSFQELPHQRNRYEVVRKIDNNRFVRTISTRPVSYHRDGIWVPINYRLEESKPGAMEDGLVATSSDSDFQLRFRQAGDIQVAANADFPEVNFFVKTRFDGTLANWSAHQVDGNSVISTADNLPIHRKVDTRYGWLKTEYTMLSPPIVSGEIFWVEEEMALENGHLLEKGSNGMLLLKNQIGDTLGIQKRPITFDGAFDYTTRTGGYVVSDYDIELLSNNIYRIRYGIPQSFLTAPERTYPIVIDPTFSFTHNFAIQFLEIPGNTSVTFTTDPCITSDSYTTAGSFYNAYNGAWQSDVLDLRYTSCGTSTPNMRCPVNAGGLCTPANQNLDISCFAQNTCAAQTRTVDVDWNSIDFGFIDGFFDLNITYTTPVFDPGNVSTPQTIASGQTPATLTSTSAATVATPCAVITYQWQQMDGACDCSAGVGSWTNIPGATGATLPSGSMGALTTDRCYRRIMTSVCNTVNDIGAANAPANRSSNCVQITVSPLPVTYSHIDVRNAQSGALLNWGTISEKNSSGFWVERINPAGEWKKLVFIESSKLSGQKSYEYLDPTIEPNTLYHYRLEQVDFDGSVGYSKVVSLQTPMENMLELKAYPNPSADGQFTVVGLTQGAAIQVYSITGQLAGTFELSASDDLNLSSLATGVYQLRHIDADGYLYSARVMNKTGQ